MAARICPGARLETFIRSGVGAVSQGKGRDGAVRRLRRRVQPCPAARGSPAGGQLKRGDRAGGLQVAPGSARSPSVRRCGGKARPYCRPRSPSRAHAWMRRAGQPRGSRPEAGGLRRQGAGQEDWTLAGTAAGGDGAQAGTSPYASAPALPERRQSWGGRRRQHGPP